MTAEFAGALSEVVTLFAADPARDDLGTATGGWSEDATVQAALAPLTPAPWGQGDRPAAAARWRALLRSGPAVAAGDRLRWRGRLFAVRERLDDPAAPDRITLTLEALP